MSRYKGCPFGCRGVVVVLPVAFPQPSVLAAFAGLDDHVGKLLDLGGFADVVKDGERLQVLGHAARGGGGLRVDGIVQAENLKGHGRGKETQGKTKKYINKRAIVCFKEPVCIVILSE